MLPAAMKADLARHLGTVQQQHQRDLARGAGWVELPTALHRKYPNASREWAWQWVFPATRFYVDEASGGDITCTNPFCNERSRMPREPPAFPGLRRVTRCATPLRRICSKAAMTYERSKNCSDTAT